MSPQQEDVLQALRSSYRGLAVWDIAQRTGDPLPSVRRTIRELRRLGYNITYSDGSGPYAGEYRLYE